MVMVVTVAASRRRDGRGAISNARTHFLAMLAGLFMFLFKQAELLLQQNERSQSSSRMASDEKVATFD